MKKNYKIIVCLMLIKEYDIDLVVNTMNNTFSMSYPQVVYFINLLLEQKLIQRKDDSFQYSLTNSGNDYLKKFGLLDTTIEVLNNSAPKINKDFYISYLKK